MASKSQARLRFDFGTTYKRKGCRSWTIDYRDKHGQRIQKVVKGVVTAQQAYDALRSAVNKELCIKEERKEITFKEYAEIYLESYAKVKKRSWKSDKKFFDGYLTPFFGDKLLSEIRHEDVRRFIAERLEEGAKKNTVNRYIEVLRRMMRLAQEDGHIEVNPVKPSDLFSESEFARDRVMSYEEEEKLMNSSASHLKAIIQFAVQTGCRLQEILRLNVSDLDFKHETITIRPESNKTGRRDIIPMNSDVKKLLHEQVIKNSGRSEHVFSYDDNHTRTLRPIKSIKVAWLNACRRAGVRGLQFRDLRRTYGTRLHEKGIDPLVISRLLRHSSVKISQEVYIHSNLKMMREAVEKLRFCDKVVTKSESEKSEIPVTSLFSVN